MKVVVVGTGYVGLVTGACFAEMGNLVTCVDIDESKVASLKQGDIPIYEPGLEALVRANLKLNLLKFTCSLDAVIHDADFIFIAVGTPSDVDGSADLRYVLGVATEIGDLINRYVVIVDKSTVPVGTADKVSEVIQARLDARGLDCDFDVVSNPEFLKEGSAIEDFVRPDRVVIGSDSELAAQKMQALYSPFVRNNDRILHMGIRDAEMTKYAANAMLATKISFINEVANLCDQMDVDVENVRKGIGSDKRIGYSFIYPGTGYGGSCFPKDVKAIINMAKQNGVQASVLEAVESRNQQQKQRLFEKVDDYYEGHLAGKHFALWGLAFKPGTDDMREAPALVLIERLVKAGATLAVYDPVALDTAKAAMGETLVNSGKIQFPENHYDALKGADAMLLVTEWKLFRQPDFIWMKALLTAPVIFDGRNQYDPSNMRAMGFEYSGIGRRN